MSSATAIVENRFGNATAAFRTLGDPLSDTISPQGRLNSTLLAAI
ncbi:hypothetical protein [Bradyrhizobium sp. URHC0002]